MEYAVYVLALVLLQGPLGATSRDWCEESCHGEKHLRCVATLKKSNPNCPKIETGFSPKERMSILDAHNRWRDYVASGLGSGTDEFMVFDPYDNETLISSKDLPPHCSLDIECRTDFFIWRDPEGQAADMRQLVWDYELENNAAIWASQCDPSSSRPYHCAFTEKFSVVHMNTDSSNWAKYPLGGGFISFMKFINYPDNYFNGDRIKLVRSYLPGIWDPFYALIYSQTHAIGCSRAFCDCHQDEYPYGLRRCGTVTCLYGPAFDKTFSLFKIYNEDKEPCSRCPAGTACRAVARYKYLCARPQDPKFPVPIADEFDQCSEHLPSPTNLCFTLVMLLATS